jgi:hypothetical protein
MARSSRLGSGIFFTRPQVSLLWIHIRLFYPGWFCMEVPMFSRSVVHYGTVK